MNAENNVKIDTGVPCDSNSLAKACLISAAEEILREYRDAFWELAK